MAATKHPKSKKLSSAKGTPSTSTAFLDLPAQFSKHAHDLVEAANEGTKLHRAKNIRDSGQLLEDAFQQLFSYALPHNFLSASGYFFGNTFALSAETDFLLCDQSEVLRLPPAKGHKTHYVPFRSVKAMGQLKTSFSQFKNALEQNAQTLLAWRSMTGLYTVEQGRREPLSIVVIAKGGTDKQARSAMAKLSKEKPLPAYVLLVEEGLLYAPDKTSRFIRGEEASYTSQGNDGPLSLLKVAGSTGKDPGPMLMWLFFGLLRYVVPEHSEALLRLTDKAKWANSLVHAQLPEISNQ